MLEFHNVRVYDLKESVISCRNSMRTDMAEITDEEFNKGLSRAKKLVGAGGGSGHTSFRKGIVVSFDMKYSQYITKQLQRYHWFEYNSSTSLMHRITKMDFDTCCNKYVSDETKAYMKSLIAEYNSLVENCENTDRIYISFMRIISNCPMGCELLVRVTTNYEQLATMYRQRRHHKLKEDYTNFCKFVESLPYANELILGL